MKFDTIAIAAAAGPEAQAALKSLSGRYDTVVIEDADVVVALGGDGFLGGGGSFLAFGSGFFSGLGFGGGALVTSSTLTISTMIGVSVNNGEVWM